MERFTDNTAAARELKSMFERGELNGSERPSEIRTRTVEFMKYSAKAFSDKFRKYAMKYGNGKPHYSHFTPTSDSHNSDR